MHFARTTFTLDAKAIAAARGVGVLALDPRAYNSTLSLRASAPLADWSTPANDTSGDTRSRTALVEVLGPIAQRGDTLCGFYDGWDTIEGRVCRAIESDENDAVVLVIDSPGGSAAGMAESVRRMRAAVEASGKPCFAYADEQATSAAYALATVATKIYMPESGCTGSIGAVIIHAEESAALAESGIAVNVIRSGSRKFEGSSIEPLSSEARASMQANVDAVAMQFASLVADARGGDADRWLALEGRAVRADEAQAKGLVDGVMGLDGVIDLAAAAAEKQAMGAEKKDAGALSAEIEIGRVALALTGASDAEGAVKTLRAWQSAAARTDVLEAEQAKRDAAAAADVVKAEEAERVELVRGLVARGALTPAKAWKSDDKGPSAENGVAEIWASMKLKTLRATAGAIDAPPGAKAAKPDVERDATTREMQERAEAYGVSPASLAAADRLVRDHANRGDAAGKAA